jgi:vitamin B12 transporter
MKSLFNVCTLAAACAASVPAMADNRLEEIIVTSSRVEMPLRKIGTSVSVVNEQEIRQRGFNSLYDVLRYQPSVSVSNSGGTGSATSLRIRGEAGGRTLVLIDGINVTDTTGTQYSPRWEHILSSNIARVEILRGPQGMMYGADAGGIVNIQSVKSDSGLAGDLSAEGGRYGTQQFAANLGGGNDSVDFNLSVTDYETDGFNSKTTDTLLKDDDGYENTTAHGRLGWNASEALRFELVARDTSGENDYDDCFGTDDCNDDYDSTSYRAAASYNAGAFTNILSYNDSETDKAFYADGFFSFGLDGGLESWEYTGSWEGSNALKLVYGVDLKTESIDDGFDKTERDQDGYYLEYQGEISDQFYTTIGARYDDNEDFGSHTSYRVSGAYVIDLNAGELKFKATYGTGFRAPSLYEISYNRGPWATPPASDSDLDEETSAGYDLGLEYHGSNGLYLEAVYFDQEVEDLIDFDNSTFSGYLQYDGKSESTGVELIGEFPLLASLQLTGNYSYTDAEDPSGEQRLRTPKHMLNLGINYRGINDRLSVGLAVRASRDAVDLDTTNFVTIDLDDYEVVDLNASFELIDGFVIFGRVENLLDEDYEEVYAYNTSGMAGYAGVRYSF